MAEIIYAPGDQNSPFGLLNSNPQGSQYATESGFSADETILLRKAIKEKIFDAAPAQFNVLKLVFDQEAKDVASDEFEYLESTFGRSPLTANSTASAVAASAGNQVTQTFDVDNASLQRLTVDLLITYPDNSEGVIKSISGNTLTIGSRTSAGLPAVAVGDVFAIRSTIMADGADDFKTYHRTEVVTRYNYVQFFLRAKRWDRIELQKYKNTGTTNFLDHDRNEKLKQLRTDLFCSYFNGNRGEYSINGNMKAKSMGGIYPTMVSAGSLSANPTPSGLQAAFETLAFQTNYKAEGSTRYIYGTQEMLYMLSQIYKQPGLRYKPNDYVADLNLQSIEFGGMVWVLVPCELFRNAACFPAEWKRKLLFIDTDSIRPVKMAGIDSFEMGSTLDKQENGTREGFKEWWVQAQLSLEFHNPLGCFYIDVQ